jgi:hypothetical protein
MKLEFSRQIFEKILKYKISWKSVQWEPSCSVWTDGRTDRNDEANSRFFRFANEPKKIWFEGMEWIYWLSTDPGGWFLLR